MKVFLTESKMLPEGFKYPSAYLEYIAGHEQDELYPWRFLAESPSEISFLIQLLQKAYPDKRLIPFAQYEDSANGDIACFDGNDCSGEPRIYFHVFCYQGEMPPWDKRYHLSSFSEWLVEAKEEAWDED